MILLVMIFMHIVDDYYLQGVLAKMKQSKWWQENAPKALYKYDYIVALIMHAFSWTFMVMLPIAYYMAFSLNELFYVWFAANLVLHAVIDNAKANNGSINLIIDQTLHLIQIIVTFAIFSLAIFN